MLIAQVPVPDPNAALQQAAQQGAVIWFAAFVLIFMGTLLVLFGYYIAIPYTKKAMELMNQTALTLTVVTDSQRKQMEMMSAIDLTSRDTSGKVERLNRSGTVYRDIVSKLATAAGVNIEAQLGRLDEINNSELGSRQHPAFTQ